MSTPKKTKNKNQNEKLMTTKATKEDFEPGPSTLRQTEPIPIPARSMAGPVVCLGGSGDIDARSLGEASSAGGTTPKGRRARQQSREKDKSRDTSMSSVDAEGMVGLHPKRPRRFSPPVGMDVEAREKSKEVEDHDETVREIAGGGDVEDLLERERKALEDYLFTDSNKVSKQAGKFILSKWRTIERYARRLAGENERLVRERSEYEDKMAEREKAFQKETAGRAPSYATMTRRGLAAGRPGTSASGQSGLPGGLEREKERINRSKETKAIIIRPVNENDERGNDEVKRDVLAGLRAVRSDLRITAMRQTRKKGMVVTVASQKDADILKGVNLKGFKLKADEPPKISPSIIVFDVDNDYSAEELKADFIAKNFDLVTEEDKNVMAERVIFRHSFKNRSNRMNWIIQVPADRFEGIISRGRVYMGWGSYRLAEYVNITRCFKCQAFGHIAKTCSAPHQLCEHCGSREHERDKCPTAAEPRCANCVRNKRKEANHSVKDKTCPEYIRQVNIYRSRIEWR